MLLVCSSLCHGALSSLAPRACGKLRGCEGVSGRVRHVRCHQHSSWLHQGLPQALAGCSSTPIVGVCFWCGARQDGAIGCAILPHGCSQLLSASGVSSATMADQGMAGCVQQVALHMAAGGCIATTLMLLAKQQQEEQCSAYCVQCTTQELWTFTCVNCLRAAAWGAVAEA
jgi:hypothetical protein